MATKNVLREAISKLNYNTNLLLEKKRTCTSKKEIEEIDKAIAQNNSMILDYTFRIDHE